MYYLTALVNYPDGTEQEWEPSRGRPRTDDEINALIKEIMRAENKASSFVFTIVPSI